MRLCYFAQSAIQTPNIGLNSRNYVQSESLTKIIKEIDLNLRFDSKIQKMNLNFWFDVKIQTNWFDFVFSQEKQSGQHLQVIFNIFVLARKIQIIDLNLCFDRKNPANWFEFMFWCETTNKLCGTDWKCHVYSLHVYASKEIWTRRPK